MPWRKVSVGKGQPVFALHSSDRILSAADRSRSLQQKILAEPHNDTVPQGNAMNFSIEAVEHTNLEYR